MTKTPTTFAATFSEKGDKSKCPKNLEERVYQQHQRAVAAAISAKSAKKSAFLSFLDEGK